MVFFALIQTSPLKHELTSFMLIFGREKFVIATDDISSEVASSGSENRVLEDGNPLLEVGERVLWVRNRVLDVGNRVSGDGIVEFCFNGYIWS